MSLCVVFWAEGEDVDLSALSDNFEVEEVEDGGFQVEMRSLETLAEALDVLERTTARVALRAQARDEDDPRVIDVYITDEE